MIIDAHFNDSVKSSQNKVKSYSIDVLVLVLAYLLDDGDAAPVSQLTVSRDT